MGRVDWYALTFPVWQRRARPDPHPQLLKDFADNCSGDLSVSNDTFPDSTPEPPGRHCLNCWSSGDPNCWRLSSAGSARVFAGRWNAQDIVQ